MKYGEHLKNNIAPEYGANAYINYERLDKIISELEDNKPSTAVETSRVVSLSAPPQTNSQGLDTSKVLITEEDFLTLLDADMVKVEKFTLTKVVEIRTKIKDVEYMLHKRQSQESTNASNNDSSSKFNDEIMILADTIANDFLRLELFVNLNFMGFHKILKKHDKNLPNFACKPFYVNRLHAQAWVRGDYSDIVVQLSNIYSALRDDTLAEENKDATQSFLRSTTKYWVKTEDVSRVKYAILRHLPVFLQKTSTGESDSQFTNSVYLDNDQLELYHGRLDKTPGAIALRLRWYGSGDPDLVFVERKTHHDKWTGSVSVKERFMTKEPEVKQVLTNTYPIEEKKQQMLNKGKSQKEADEWETLVKEITQVISSKQLVPTMRTQCMRTAFQIPFDATVRVSLDTNLCMISERGYDLKDMSQWHRDKHWVLEKNEIHRFPHAVLEIKLEIKEADMSPPQWVTDLQNSGLLYECHKYSKFVHGCAVLLPEDVQYVPYWLDDVSLRQSIIDSGGEGVLADATIGVGPGANNYYSHLLPFGTTTNDRTTTAVGRTSADIATAKGIVREHQLKSRKNENNSTTNKAKNGTNKKFDYGNDYHDDDDDLLDENLLYTDDFDEETTACGWLFPFCSRANNTTTNANSAYDNFLAPTSIQKIEPKVFFANERTFLHWLHFGVILSTIASGILAYSEQTNNVVGEIYALVLLPISLGFCIYALNTFLWRADRIRSRIPAQWSDATGPMYLGYILATILSINFFLKLYAIVTIDNDTTSTTRTTAITDTTTTTTYYSDNNGGHYNTTISS